MKIKNLILDVLVVLFVVSLAFLMGSAYKENQWKERVYNWNCTDLNDFYSDSSWRYQEGYKLNLPEELSQLEQYDAKEVDLLASFIDDAGEIHFMYTGLKYPSDSLLLTR